jgi:hypothetical protein
MMFELSRRSVIWLLLFGLEVPLSPEGRVTDDYYIEWRCGNLSGGVVRWLLGGEST